MTRNVSRFIPGEDIQVVSDWAFGAVDSAGVRFAAKINAQAVQEEQAREAAVRQAAYTEGYSEGFSQGHAQATLEGQRQINEYIATQGHEAAATFGRLFESADAQMAESEQVMARGVLDLACELARQVLRHELSTNPNALQPVIREALGLLSIECKTAVVRMNPVDHEVLADVVQQEFSSLALTLLPDATVSRGGCIVESSGTVVDATVEKRWKRVVANLGLEASWETDDAPA